ncbi:MAG: hypothetical protein GF320_08820 [Armatimonadia bacterium]|jgi:NADH-quinone oxidoreductase subunit J|nr:hypothetical protein [Armatimonadia bacterium]
METLVFFCLAVPVLILAAVVVTTPHILRAVVSLFLALIGIGGLFFLMRAPILGVMQLMIYAGGVVVLFAFAVMLVRRVTGEFVRQKTSLVGPALVVALLFFAVLMGIGSGYLAGLEEEGTLGGFMHPTDLDLAERVVITDVPEEIDPVDEFSPAMLRDYLLPFEIASVLLLVAMVGAVLIAHPLKQKHPTGALSPKEALEQETADTGADASDDEDAGGAGP